MKKLIFAIAFTMVAAFSFASFTSVTTNVISSSITQEEPKKEKAEAKEEKSEKDEKACAEKKSECAAKKKSSCEKTCGGK